MVRDWLESGTEGQTRPLQEGSESQISKGETFLLGEHVCPLRGRNRCRGR